MGSGGAPKVGTQGCARRDGRSLPWALPEAPFAAGRERPGTGGTAQRCRRLCGNPCPPQHPAHPHPHPARPILTTTIQGPFPPAPASSAQVLALRPQGHVCAKTEGTRSKRECGCFKIPVLWPHSHWPPKHYKGADVLQVTRWLERAQPGRCGAGRLRALHSWTVGQSLSHGLRSEPPEVNHCRVDSPAHGASTHCPLCETGT